MEDTDVSETPISFHEMGETFTPGQRTYYNPQDGVAVFKLGADAQLHVEFYEKRTPIPFKSMNGVTHFEKEDYVIIRRPNDKSWPDRKVREEDKRRFPEQWFRYKNGQSQEIGDKIEVLQNQGLLTAGQVEMLRYTKILSVQQLAKASELVVASFGTEGHQMQKIAQGWLNYKAQIEHKDGYAKLKAALDAERAELQKERDVLSKQMEEMRQLREVLLAANKPQAEDVQVTEVAKEEEVAEVATAPEGVVSQEATPPQEPQPERRKRGRPKWTGGPVMVTPKQKVATTPLPEIKKEA